MVALGIWRGFFHTVLNRFIARRISTAADIAGTDNQWEKAPGVLFSTVTLISTGQ
jgi:hypothetical protein